eukprot:3683727-Prymnesium_polylepis.2
MRTAGSASAVKNEATRMPSPGTAAPNAACVTASVDDSSRGWTGASNAGGDTGCDCGNGDSKGAAGSGSRGVDGSDDACGFAGEGGGA